MKSAVVVVDFQNDFVCGSLGFPAAADLEQPICKRLESALNHGEDILFTFDTHEENYLETQEGKLLPIPHCIRGSKGWELYGKTASFLTDSTPVFCKNTFGSLDLADYLAKQGYDRVEFLGLVSNICVLSNAVLAKAALPESTISVNAALTGSSDPVLHRASLDVLRGIQVEIIGDTLQGAKK